MIGQENALRSFGIVRAMNEYDSIKLFFETNDENGEFLTCSENAVSRFFPPIDKDLIYCTKNAFSELVVDINIGLGFLFQVGFPNKRTLEWLKQQNFDVKFLGDLDPVDLLIFRILQTITDNVTFLNPYESIAANAFVQEQTVEEKQAFKHFESQFQEIENAISPSNYKLVKSGKKIELEAVADSIQWFLQSL